jgi:hypothetical protein
MLFVHFTLLWCLALHNQFTYLIKLLTAVISYILCSPYSLYRLCLKPQDEISHSDEESGDRSSSDEERSNMVEGGGNNSCKEQPNENNALFTKYS